MDPGDFHTNWEESLWSRNCPEIDDLLLGSWTTVEEPDSTQDTPKLRHDPFTMNLTETDSFTADVPKLQLTETPDLTPKTDSTMLGHQKIHSEPALKRKVGRPCKTERRVVTVLPTGEVSELTLREARYRRKRDLNNIASSKCRLNR